MKQLSHLSNFWPPENGRLCIKGLDSKQFMQYFCQPLELNLKVRTLTNLLQSAGVQRKSYNEIHGLMVQKSTDQTVVTQDLVAGKTVTSKET